MRPYAYSVGGLMLQVYYSSTFVFLIGKKGITLLVHEALSY
jgi:hypothetical protein